MNLVNSPIDELAQSLDLGSSLNWVWVRVPLGLLFWKHTQIGEEDGLKVKNNVYYLPCDSYQISKQLKNVKNNKFIIGPTNGSCKFGKKDYNPDNVEKSSVCVGVECVFGTNEETVKKNIEENLFRK